MTIINFFKALSLAVLMTILCWIIVDKYILEIELWRFVCIEGMIAISQLLFKFATKDFTPAGPSESNKTTE